MHHWLLITLLLISGNLTAEERLELDGTSIIGSNELPQVLIIVPWKKTGMRKIRMPAEMSLVQKMLEPVDRTVFRREINYFYTMNTTKTD
jgi:hypothetical protein